MIENTEGFKFATSMMGVNIGDKFKVLKSRKFSIGSIVKTITKAKQFGYASPYTAKCEDENGNQGWVPIMNMEEV